VPQVLPVEFLASGEQGTIVEVEGAGDAVCRLAEIGFQPGVRVRMVQSGRPCILAIGNHRLTFRGEDAATVLVEVSAGAVARGTDEARSG
jgi:Fe2+ transport system protein FeoA